MDCCILSDEEVGRLTHYGISPNHEHHRHMKVKQALEWVKEDKLNIVESKDGRFYVTWPKMYYLRPVLSCGVITTIQRVVSNQPLHVSPA
jgi:hypothetical protein